ncbi:acyl-CoA N-acyltransferase [Hyaloscypha bicolor E]|uniref:Acyl-CoA N-acyltransferase n=1 Tax=Hyaloscypha bicolor E TaxID=1095630 RepID=A0A2J6SYS7_9HELO|nr:acyl-CoA N-acyltransferase [Hyaloscypha bicolor E]PMD55927.1 acyl-CoA N-acyltransferase [Hyaloscypha bicolor E]
MAPENFILSTCTPADIPAMVELNLSAFANDPLSNITMPREMIGEAELRRWMSQFIASFFEKPEVHFFKITETHTGSLAAWMRCAFPHVLSEEESEKRKAEKEQKVKDKSFWPKGANLDVINVKFGTLGQLKEYYCNDSETYYVQLLATDPAYQRRGLASKLLKQVLQIADRGGKMSYIEATEAGFPVYQKLLFKQVDIVEVDLSRWGGKGTTSNRIMQREPQPIL